MRIQSRFLLFTFLLIISPFSPIPVHGEDGAIQKIIQKAFDQIRNGNMEGVVACCHPEIGKFKGTFDTGYTPGRSGSLGELMVMAMSIAEKETLLITNLKIEVVREEKERAIAWAYYHVMSDRPSSLEMTKGERVKEEWNAKDYIILKKYKGEWRLRRLEDRAGHFLPVELQQQTEDPWGGII